MADSRRSGRNFPRLWSLRPNPVEFLLRAWQLPPGDESAAADPPQVRRPVLVRSAVPLQPMRQQHDRAFVVGDELDYFLPERACRELHDPADQVGKRRFDVVPGQSGSAPHNHIIRHPRAARPAPVDHLRAGGRDQAQPAFLLVTGRARHLRRSEAPGIMRPGRGQTRTRRPAAAHHLFDYGVRPERAAELAFDATRAGVLGIRSAGSRPLRPSRHEAAVADGDRACARRGRTPAAGRRDGRFRISRRSSALSAPRRNSGLRARVSSQLWSVDARMGPPDLRRADGVRPLERPPEAAAGIETHRAVDEAGRSPSAGAPGQGAA